MGWRGWGLARMVRVEGDRKQYGGALVALLSIWPLEACCLSPFYIFVLMPTIAWGCCLWDTLTSRMSDGAQARLMELEWTPEWFMKRGLGQNYSVNHLRHLPVLPEFSATHAWPADRGLSSLCQQELWQTRVWHKRHRKQGWQQPLWG